VVFISDTLIAPMKIRRQPVANLIASPAAPNSDWVVKLIDLYPTKWVRNPRWAAINSWLPPTSFAPLRESFETPRPSRRTAAALSLRASTQITSSPGHRIMVQIQSSWFPLYDRNPQTFVPNIFWAKPGDYRKATQRIYQAPGRQLSSSWPIVPPHHEALTREAETLTATRVTLPRHPWYPHLFHFTRGELMGNALSVFLFLAFAATSPAPALGVSLELGAHRNCCLAEDFTRGRDTRQRSLPQDDGRHSESSN